MADGLHFGPPICRDRRSNTLHRDIRKAKATVETPRGWVGCLERDELLDRLGVLVRGCLVGEVVLAGLNRGLSACWAVTDLRR